MKIYVVVYLWWVETHNVYVNIDEIKARVKYNENKSNMLEIWEDGECLKRERHH